MTPHFPFNRTHLVRMISAGFAASFTVLGFLWLLVDAWRPPFGGIAQNAVAFALVGALCGATIGVTYTRWSDTQWLICAGAVGFGSAYYVVQPHFDPTPLPEPLAGIFFFASIGSIGSAFLGWILGRWRIAALLLCVGGLSFGVGAGAFFATTQGLAYLIPVTSELRAVREMIGLGVMGGIAGLALGLVLYSLARHRYNQRFVQQCRQQA